MGRGEEERRVSEKQRERDKKSKRERVREKEREMRERERERKREIREGVGKETRKSVMKTSSSSLHPLHCHAHHLKHNTRPIQS